MNNFIVKFGSLKCLLLLFLGYIDTTAQELVPPIQNYSAVEYGAASQNWDIGVDDDGIIYSANNQGLLVFDGLRWELFPLETKSIIRSVLPVDDKIYIGSYEEFGYWSRDKTGEMQYTSLKPLLKDLNLQNEEFWQIISFQDAIYFRSFGAIYKYDKHKITRIKEVVSNEITVFNEKLLVSKGQDGLFFLKEDGTFKSLANQDILKGEAVMDVAVVGEDLLVGTRNALYKYDNGIFSLYPDRGLNEDLKKFELNHIIAIPNEQLIIGTVKNGIIHYDPTESKYVIYNRNNGLQNNTILGLARNKNKVWLALDNGIDQLELESPIKFYTDDTGELGAVYDLAFFNDALYLASNTGVYRLKEGKLYLVEGAEGHCWNLEVIGNSLYSNHNTGTYEVLDDKFVALEERTGSFDIAEAPEDVGINFVGTYTGISLYDPEEEGVEILENVRFPVKHILFEKPSVLWAAHPYEGLYRVGLDDNLSKTRFVEKIDGIDTQGNYKSQIYKIKDQIAVFDDDKWYKYNSFSGELEAFTELRKYEHYKLLQGNNTGFWFTDTRENTLLYTDFENPEVVVSPAKLDYRLVKGNENVIQVNDSTYYVTLNDGFAKIDFKKLIKSSKTDFISTPFIKGFLDKEGRYDLTKIPEVPYQNARNINVATALPVSDASQLRYELVHDSDTLQGEVQKGKLQLQNLQQGDYILNLLTVGPRGAIQTSAGFAFIVNAPWYLSNVMKGTYIFLLLCGVYAIYWFNRSNLRKHEYVLEQKFQKEHQDRLERLEKERLQTEITTKRKELANSTMLAAKKNEVLMEIQTELNKDKGDFSNQYRRKHLLSKINKAIRDKNEWKVFETNFNELHEDFFKDLLDTYPNLTTKDLKLCSYLKMNLSSKEIAPLMGISVRGVEVHRYRLRRKMELDKNENLANFLIKRF